MPSIHELMKDAKTPLDAVTAMFNAEGCSTELQNAIQDSCFKFLNIDMPKMVIMKQCAVARPVEGTPSTLEVFDGAMDYARKNSPQVDKALSATVKDVARNIAAEIDAGLKRILLDDKVLVTEAHLDLLACHAELVSILEGIKLTPEQEKIWEKVEAEAEVAKAEAESA